ncbi:peripherin-2-like [Sitophilus oryzae]|uniref:Peripherin-2-like n=1 Tax=Sitophilus oryzae TaxID=7048 RepID=A0A6J2YN88_SITOR|nr:peripherin-2-like [Sitophilus oryzae]
MKSLKSKIKNKKKVDDSKPKKDKTKPKDKHSSKEDVIVRFGKPILQINFKRIKLLVTVAVILILIITILSVNCLITAIKIRSHLGAFINMISSGEGEILPTMLALPTFVFLCLNLGAFFFVYKLFSKKKSPGANSILFILILLILVLVVSTVLVVFITLGHAYGAHEKLHDGIIETMKKYAVNSYYKIQMDRLQIEFQCCGSKKYDEWYNITWFDKDVSSNTSTGSADQTPFSCCAMRTNLPCIHYDIEKTGRNYMYTPEFNLSISTTGCYTRVIEKKRQVGLSIIGYLFLVVFLELLLLLPLRFLQTGHSIDSKFEGNSKTYTVWLIGTYTGKNQSNAAPEPPPLPPELLD